MSIWATNPQQDGDFETDPTICQVKFMGKLCGGEVIGVMVGGCVHEHIGQGAHICQRCVEFTEQNEIICDPCQKTDGHICRIKFEFSELEVAK